MKIEFAVYGSPAPQGSKRHVGKGVMLESSKRVKPWRHDVAIVALGARGSNPPIDAPARVRLVFTVPKPASAPKRRRSYPIRKPDIDKLVRAVLDAIVTAGVLADDARVIDLSALKVFPGEHPDALDAPGVRVFVGPAELTE